MVRGQDRDIFVSQLSCLRFSGSDRREGLVLRRGSGRRQVSRHLDLGCEDCVVREHLSSSHPTAAAPQAWIKQAISRAGRGGGLSVPGPAGQCSGRGNTGRDYSTGSAANCFLGFAARAE